MLEKSMEELVRVYEDLEKTLKGITESSVTIQDGHYSINIRKLVEQLSRSKKRLERKIGNKILLERQNLRKRIKRFASM